jgi:hypothetical protein
MNGNMLAKVGENLVVLRECTLDSLCKIIDMNRSDIHQCAQVWVEVGFVQCDNAEIANPSYAYRPDYELGMAFIEARNTLEKEHAECRSRPILTEVIQLAKKGHDARTGNKVSYPPDMPRGTRYDEV